MRSLNHHHHHHVACPRLFRSRNHHHPFSTISSFPPPSSSSLSLKIVNVGSNVGRLLRPRMVQSGVSDEDLSGVSTHDDWGDNNGAVGYMLSSSDGEDSDGEYVINPANDIDLPTAKVSTNDALTVTAHRLGMIGRGRKKRRTKLGTLNNLGLIAFLTVLLLFVDWCAWKIVRLPLPPFYLSRPFFISAAIVSLLGYFCVPLFNELKFHQIIRKERPFRHSNKRVTPTMGGLFFVPIGVGVAKSIAGFNSVEVSGAAVATLAFGVIGLLDDVLTILKKHNSGLSAWVKIFLEVAVGICFSIWLDAASISSPYSMKMLVPLPTPLGLVCLGNYYLMLTSFCFVSMGNGVKLTDGVDGLAGGTAALALVGMSIAVLPICSDLAIFGASMAGACFGFLLHNRYKASVFMGDTGSLALGAALAAMAACTGMFLPLFIASGIFVLEASSVIMQQLLFNLSLADAFVPYFFRYHVLYGREVEWPYRLGCSMVLYSKTTKSLRGASCHLLRMAPLHHHLELCGFKEPIIVAGAYVISGALAVLAGYVGLISA